MILRGGLPEIQPSPATHAQKSNPATLRNTRYLCGYKPLLTVEPAEPAAQGIILIKTANAVITFFPNVHLYRQKMDFKETRLCEIKSEYDRDREWHATIYNEHIGSMAALSPLERAVLKQVYRPQESTWKPPLPQKWTINYL